MVWPSFLTVSSTSSFRSLCSVKSKLASFPSVRVLHFATLNLAESSRVLLYQGVHHILY